MSYARGFGDSANFWLGNDNLNAVTSGGARLWVSLEDADNNWRYAAYENFSVASALENYMAIFEGYSGTAGDSLSYHNGSNFSTSPTMRGTAAAAPRLTRAPGGTIVVITPI